MLADRIETAARQLAEAHGAPPLSALTPPPATMAQAYRIQARTIALLGPVGGWKHGLLDGRTLSCAPILRDAIHESGVTLPLATGLKIEIETAVRLAAPLRSGADKTQIRAAIGAMHLAFECLGPRFAAPAERTPLEVMADRFSNHALVIGDEIPNWDSRDLASLPIAAMSNASPDGRPRGMSMQETLAFLGFVAAQAEDQGTPLQAGQIIITGARLGPVTISHPARVRAAVGDATIELSFA